MAKQSFPNGAPSVRQLQEDGWTIRFQTKAIRKTHIITTCVIVSSQSSIYIGTAACLYTDSFNRKKGNAMALGRAWKETERFHHTLVT